MNERVSIQVANMRFTALTSSIIAAFSLLVTATPMLEVFHSTITSLPITHFVWQSNLISVEQFKHWLATTDADVTFIGEPLGDLSDLSKRNALNTVVTYCNTQNDNVCTGLCTVYNGAGPVCLSAPGTACLFATNDVYFCNTDGGECINGSCNDFSSCGTVLDNGFCSTPNTNSIFVLS